MKIVDEMPDRGSFIEVFLCGQVFDSSKCMWTDEGLMEYYHGEWINYQTINKNCEVKYIVKD